MRKQFEMYFIPTSAPFFEPIQFVSKHFPDSRVVASTADREVAINPPPPPPVQLAYLKWVARVR
jgi:hypothetical protein